MPVLQLDNRREALAKEEAPCHLDLSKLIQSGTKTFFNNPALSDLTLVCPDGRALHCHSIILAAASRRFAAALKQGNWTPGQQMPVKGVDSDALETLVCAFYTAECPLELGKVPALYDAAVKLEVPSLAPALEQYLNSALQPHNCCQVLELCLSMGVSQLSDLVLAWIRGRVSDVVPSAEFRSSRLETAACICKDLAHRSQLVGLQAAVSWLSASAPRSSLVGVFAEATGLTVDAIQAVAVSGAALGPVGHGGSGGSINGLSGGLLQFSGHSGHVSHGIGHGGHGGGGASGLLGSGIAAATHPAAQSLNLSQALGPGGGGGGGAEGTLGGGSFGLSAGTGLGMAASNGGGGGSGTVQVLQLLPTASGSQAAVLVMPSGNGNGGAGGISGESGHHTHGVHHHGLGVGGLQSLLTLHDGGGGGKGGNGNGLGALGLGSGGGHSGGGGSAMGFGLDALADAAEGERVQKRLRGAGAGGPPCGGGGGGGACVGPGMGIGGGGGFTAAAESGSATSMHSDMSGGGKRMNGLDDRPQHLPSGRMGPRDPNLALQQQQQAAAMNHHTGKQLQQYQPQSQQQQQQRGSKPVGSGRGGVGGRRRRAASASDDDEDYAPSGGRSGAMNGGVGGGGCGVNGVGGGGGRARAQDFVYGAETLLDGPSAAGGGEGGGGVGGEVGSDPGEDDAGGQNGGDDDVDTGGGAAGDVASPKPGGGAGSGGTSGGGGGSAQGGTPVLMTGRRAPAQKGMCHVQGCHRSLQGLRDYYQRYKICEFHLKVSSVLKDGVPHRFCQQCGRFHPLTEFDGDRRSCRTMLQRHCHRRAKQKQELAEVLAQRFEEKQVAASMSAVVAAMARNAQAAGGMANLSPMLHLQYLAGLPAAAAAAAAAALDEEQLGSLGAAAALKGTAAVRSGGSNAGSDGSGGSAKTRAGPMAANGRAGRGSLPPGLHSPPSKAQLFDAVQRARKQHVQAQKQLFGLAPDVPLAAALAAAATVVGNDRHDDAMHDDVPSDGGGNGLYSMQQGPQLGVGADNGDGGSAGGVDGVGPAGSGDAAPWALKMGASDCGGSGDLAAGGDMN